MLDEDQLHLDVHVHTSTNTQGKKLPNHAQVDVGAGPDKPEVKPAYIPNTRIYSVKACQRQHSLHNRNESF